MQRITYEPQDIELLKKQLDTLSKVRPKTMISTLTLNIFDSVKVTKPKIFITATAYVKMCTIVKECDGEIGWHLLMRKHTTGLYEVYDVLIYPQKASAAYIEVDDEERNKWQNKMDINVFKAIHGQVHSHVNMSCTPSGVDKTHYEEVTNLIKSKPENYYLFAIVNKKGDLWANFYDYEQNIIFDTKEIEITIMNESGEDIINEIKEEIKTNLKKPEIPRMYYYESQNSIYKPEYKPATKKETSKKEKKIAKEKIEQERQAYIDDLNELNKQGVDYDRYY